MTAVIVDQDKIDRAAREGWLDQIRTDADRRFVQAGGVFDRMRVFRVLSLLAIMVLGTGRWAGHCFETQPWQAERVIGPVWGWRWPDGSRRYSRVLVYVPKKNGKTTFCAALGIILTAFDDEPGARVYSVARQKSQAALVWEEARDIILRTQQLTRRFLVLPAAYRIIHPATGSEWAVLPKGAEDKEGLNASAVIVDELHVIENRRLLPALRYSGAARENFLQFVLTTAGEVEDGTIWGEELAYARKVLSGEIIDDGYLPVIYEADLTQHDPGSEEAWKQANPSYGVTIRPQEMREAWAIAQGDQERRAEFLRYRLNVAARTSRGAIDLADWNACTGEIDLDALRGRPCLAALDLGRRRDMAAFGVLYAPRSQADPTWSFEVDYWLPEETLSAPVAGEDEIIDKATRAQYREWVRAGLLHLTPGRFTDYRLIRDHIVAKHRELKFRRVLFDPWDASQLSAELLDLDVPMVEFSQTLKMYAPAAKELVEVILPGRRLAHGNHPILTWNARNLVWWKDRQGNRRPDKQATKACIDGMVCLLMTIGQAITMKDLVPKTSKYNTEDMRGV